MPPPQVGVAPATEQGPVQVMLQTPEAHTTLEPAPTVWVHEAPVQVTLQLGPQMPVQVEPDSQLKRQFEVIALQTSKPQVCEDGQSHAVPEQTLPQPATNRAKAKGARRRNKDMGDSLSYLARMVSAPGRGYKQGGWNEADRAG